MRYFCFRTKSGLTARQLGSVIAASAWLFLAFQVRAAAAGPGDIPRFFHSGDGRIHLKAEKTGETFSGAYRIEPGHYDPEALSAICRVFGAPCDGERQRVSLRLIEFIDYLEDRLNPGAQVTVVSGYRSPVYNAGLRKQGVLAAKASLHQYGMAADLTMEGVPARRLWTEIRESGFGGAGYYHGQTVHVDTGPARFWDETTSGVGTGRSDDNKLIGLVADFDRYRPGETAILQFVRMTAFPIGVDPVFALVRTDEPRQAEPVASVRPGIVVSAGGGCPRFSSIDQMASIRFALPEDLPSGRYAVTSRFCGNLWPGMPPQVTTAPFTVSGPQERP